MASVDLSNALNERTVTLRVAGLRRLMLRMRLGLWLMRLSLRIMGFGTVEMVVSEAMQSDQPSEGVGG